jgi:RNA polymerase sigma-70 factor (ECF subfamily)
MSRTLGHPAPDDTTKALCERLVEDLDAGFIDLVHEYEGLLYSVALRLCARPVEAEDLAAEAFLRAYHALRDYGHSRILQLRPRSWLLTIVLNVWRNSIRTASRRPQQITVADVPERPTATTGVEEQIERDESVRELSAMVAQLPTSQRIAVVLRHVEGLPMAEIAAVLDCPEGTAKSHVSRGLQHLRKLYASAHGFSLADTTGPVPAPVAGMELK